MPLSVLFSTKSRAFFVGMLLGQLLMCGQIYRFWKTPVIIAEPCDNVFEKYTKNHTYFIHNMPKRGQTFQIRIRPQAEVITAFNVFYHESDPDLLGFTMAHQIICVNSIEVLIHELRHVYEGNYHRNMSGADNRGLHG